MQIPLGNFTQDEECLFKAYFSHQVVLSTMSVIASSIILLSSVQDHVQDLGKRRIISYLLILVSPSPSMPAQIRLKSSYKLEMKHCHCAPGSQLAESALFKAGRRSLPKKSYFGKTSSKISYVAV